MDEPFRLEQEISVIIGGDLFIMNTALQLLLFSKRKREVLDKRRNRGQESAGE